MTLVNVPNFMNKRHMGAACNPSFAADFLRPGFQDRVNGNLPSVNVAETDLGFRIELAAPGLEKGDFKLSLDKDILTIKVEKTASEEESTETFVRREFNYTKFERSFQLPKTIDHDKIDAKYDAGVLHVSLPKREEAQPKPAREITIE
jgi:HSP20 family protein